MHQSRLAELGLTPRGILKLLRWLRHTRWPLVVLYAVYANLLGAAVVFGFLQFGLPPQDAVSYTELGGPSAQLLFFAVLGVVFLITSLLSLRYAVPTLIWHYRRRDHPQAQLAKDRALRLPAALLWTSASQWFFGSLLFFGFIARHSPRLALIGAFGASLGGAVTCALIYLRSEVVLRPITTDAIAEGASARKASRVSRRLLIVWLLGSGLPILAVFAVASGHELGVLKGSTDQFIVPILFLSAVAVSVGLLSASLISSAVGRPIGDLRLAMRRVEEGDLSAHIPVDTSTELGLLQSGFNDMVRQIRERARLHDMFGRFVGPDVAERALADGVSLGGQERFVAVLFVDLVGSTQLTYDNEASSVVELLNEFFRAIVDVVGAQGGFVNKFQGDAALAIFGAPLELDNFAGHALRAGRLLAEELSQALGAVCGMGRSPTSPMDFGIGVSAGKVIAGHIGARERFEYTVIGDAVNEAARLCELAKAEPGHLLASARAVLSADPEEIARWDVGTSMVLRGRGSPTQLARPRT